MIDDENINYQIQQNSKYIMVAKNCILFSVLSNKLILTFYLCILYFCVITCTDFLCACTSICVCIHIQHKPALYNVNAKTTVRKVVYLVQYYVCACFSKRKPMII